YVEARDLFRQTLAMRRKQLGETHMEVGTSLMNLADSLYRNGEYIEAEKTFRQSIDVYHKSLKPDHWLIHLSESRLGTCLVKLKRYQEAEGQMLDGYGGLKLALGEGHWQTQNAVGRLIDLYEIWGRPERANFYRALPHSDLNKPKN